MQIIWLKARSYCHLFSADWKPLDKSFQWKSIGPILDRLSFGWKNMVWMTYKAICMCVGGRGCYPVTKQFSSVLADTYKYTSGIYDSVTEYYIW